MEVIESYKQFLGSFDRAVVLKQRLKYLKGTPRGFPKGAPFGLYLPIHGKVEPPDGEDENIRYIQNDYFGEDYFGTGWR